MYCKPQPWTSVFDGGYLTADAQRGNPLIQSKRLSYRELRAIDKELQANPQIFEAVNKMQNVSFRIDQKSKDYQNIIAQVRKRKIKECDRKITAYVEQIAKLKGDLAQVDPI
jgi:DNA-directed RNA polymerase